MSLQISDLLSHFVGVEFDMQSTVARFATREDAVKASEAHRKTLKVGMTAYHSAKGDFSISLIVRVVVPSENMVLEAESYGCDFDTTDAALAELGDLAQKIKAIVPEAFPAQADAAAGYYGLEFGLYFYDRRHINHA